MWCSVGLCYPDLETIEFRSKMREAKTLMKLLPHPNSWMKWLSAALRRLCRSTPQFQLCGYKSIKCPNATESFYVLPAVPYRGWTSHLMELVHACKYLKIWFLGRNPVLSLYVVEVIQIPGAAQRKTSVQESKSRWLFSSQFGTSEQQQLLLLWHSFFFFFKTCICHAKEVAQFWDSQSF